MRINIKGNSIKGFISFLLLFLIFTLFLSSMLLVMFGLNKATESPNQTFEISNSKVEVNASNIIDFKSFTVQIFIKGKNDSHYSTASGVIISADGYIVSNDHIYKDIKEPQFLVRLSNGKYYNGAFIGGDVATDLSLLKIDESNLPYAAFESSNKLNEGEEIFTVGNPACESLEFTVTKGVISYIGRRIVTSNGYSPPLLQIDAAVNPGSSGGPIINSFGKVVGITTSKITEQGYDSIGFAVTGEIVEKTVSQLKVNGRITNRGKMGINYQFVKEYDKRLNGIENGLKITKIEAQSNFFGSEIIEGDTIKSINGISVLDDYKFLNVLDNLLVGDKIELVIRKQDGREVALTGKAIKEISQNSYYSE